MGVDCLLREIFLIRHAVTDVAGVLCGQLDPPLNATGRAQANALAVSLKGSKICRLYASDLQRALQTAVPLAALWNTRIEPRTDLREMSFGAWEGKKWSEIHPRRPARKTGEGLPEISPLGGETSTSFRCRILQALGEIVADPCGGTIAIVTHLGVIRVILKELRVTGQIWDPHERIGHCAVYRIRIDKDSSELVDLHL